MLEKIRVKTDGIFSEIKELSDSILNEPELGLEEFKSCKKHVDLLKKHNFKITEKVSNLKTAFIAEYDTEISGPVIGYIAEYDALPEIGHGCGHNVLGAVGTGSAIVLSKMIEDIGGKVILFGTPAEETHGSKVDMARDKIFKKADVVLVAHPAPYSCASGTTFAIKAINIEFFGESTHASASPELGNNALDGLLLTFTGINSLRYKLTNNTKINGIIENGGSTPNVIPDYANGKFYIRCSTKHDIQEVFKNIENIAKGAAEMTGTTYKISDYENSFDDLKTNKYLSNIYVKYMNMQDHSISEKGFTLPGSTDMGNVSYQVPSIHPLFEITEDSTVPLHNIKFTNATNTSYCYTQMKKVINALTAVGLEIVENEDILREVYNEFNSN